MAFKLTEVSFKQTDRLDKIVYEVGLKDLVDTLRFVAADEVNAQLRLKNTPTSIIVDSSGRRPIDTATKRVQVFFGNTDEIRKAVYDAWNKTISLTKQRTGRAVSTYELWFKEQRIGRTPAACELVLPRFNPATDYFRIVGPVIVYGRKLYWSPKGTPRFRKTTAFRSKATNTTVKLVRIRGIMDLVEQSMRRKYRSIAIAEDWVRTAALPKDGRTPGLWIGFKKKGSLLARLG